MYEMSGTIFDSAWLFCTRKCLAAESFYFCVHASVTSAFYLKPNMAL